MENREEKYGVYFGSLYGERELERLYSPLYPFERDKWNKRLENAGVEFWPDSPLPELHNIESGIEKKRALVFRVEGGDQYRIDVYGSLIGAGLADATAELYVTGLVGDDVKPAGRSREYQIHLQTTSRYLHTVDVVEGTIRFEMASDGNEVSVKPTLDVGTHRRSGLPIPSTDRKGLQLFCAIQSHSWMRI